MALNDEELERYARHIVLREIGGPGQAKIQAARVLVIGAGGLGSPIALYLAAAGIGTLGLVDDDRVSLSNLQRQILFRAVDVGRLKTDVAVESIKELNPWVQIEPHALRLTTENAQALIARYDLVVDGSDNFETRFAVHDAAYAAQKTLISAAVTEFDGQLATYKAHAGNKKYPCYRCFNPAPPPPGTVPNCSETGVLGAAAGVMGTLAALEVLKEITGVGEGLAGKLLIFDALHAQFRTVTVPPDPDCGFCGTGRP
jgi:adenylyltransferase/sulfurtransferase